MKYLNSLLRRCQSNERIYSLIRKAVNKKNKKISDYIAFIRAQENASELIPYEYSCQIRYLHQLERLKKFNSKYSELISHLIEDGKIHCNYLKHLLERCIRLRGLARELSHEK